MKTKEFTLPKELLPDWGPYSKKVYGDFKGDARHSHSRSKV